MVFSVQFMLMAVYATVEYFMSPLSNSLYCYRRTMFSMRYMPVIQVHNELSQVPWGLWPQGFSCKKKISGCELKGLGTKMNW
jgi:hypothetical protein